MAPPPHTAIGANLSVAPYDASQYIQTAMTGNRVSKKSIIMGSSNIILGGKCIIHQSAIVRGDLKKVQSQQSSTNNVVVSIGRYSVLGESCVIRPPYKTYKGVFSYYPLKMGDHVHVGMGSVVEATAVGSWVEIGRNCTLGKFCNIKDCVRILDGSVIPPNTTVSSGTIWAGSPAKCVGELSENFAVVHEQRSKDYYARFRPASTT